MFPLVHQNCPVTLTGLPNETLSAVFKDLPHSTLAVVARLSYRFQGVAERLLYSSVLITDVLSESSPLPSKTLRWCASMRQRLYFVESTKRLQIRWQADPGTSPSHHLDLACTKIAKALRKLVCLRSLEIFLGPANIASCPYDERIHAVERAIRGCQLPHLQYCSLGAEWTKRAQPYTTILTSFLVSLQALRHLKLADHHSCLALPANALPHLSSFRGSADAAAELLPGRPVHALSLMGQDSDVNQGNLPLMTCTTVPLRYLDLSAMSVRLLLLRHISTHLSTVETLRIRLALRHTLHYALNGIRLLAGLSAVLNAFTQLTFLDLSPTDVEGIGRADAKEEILLCVEWGRACPSLTRIIFPSQSEWIIQEGVWSEIWFQVPYPA